jgi:ATP-binding cassette subfamily B protein
MATKSSHPSVIQVVWVILRTTYQLCPLPACISVACALLAGFLNVRSPKILQQIIDRLVSNSKTQLRNVELPLSTTTPGLSASASASSSFGLAGLYTAAGDSTLVGLILTLAVTSLAASIFRSLTVRLSFYIGTRVEDFWRYRALRKVYQLPMAWHDGHDGAELNARIQRGGDSIMKLVENGFGGSDLLVSVLTLIFALVTVMVQNPELWWIFTLPLPLYVGSSRLLGRQAKAMQPKTDAFYDQSHVALADGLSNVKVVKAFHREDTETDRYRDAWDNFHLMKIRQGLWYMLAGWARASVELIMRCLLLLSVAASHASSNRAISVGEVVQFLAIQQMILGPLGSINAMFHSAQRDAVSCAALLNIAQHPIKEDRHCAKDLKPLTKEISFRKVTFRYSSAMPPIALSASGLSQTRLKRQLSDGSNTTAEAAAEAAKNRFRVIKDLSFSIPAGTTTALVGRSGSGKTTISWLVCRFYDPEMGSIYWDDTDLQDATWMSLRKQIGVVPQEVSLFNRTIRENIAYGMPEASPESIVAAAKLSHAHDFIMRLPLGYDTIVGEQGRRLSGGQRQRIAIARALLLDPSVLILDESSSQLDSECEEAIRDCVQARQNRGNYTTLIIAHRLSTVLRADQIVCLDFGKIAARGTHEELLKNNKMYQKWYRFQCMTEQEEGDS